jgi:putative sterol carrier protein
MAGGGQVKNLLAANIVIIFAGIVIFVLGAWILSTQLASITNDLVYDVSIAIIAVGIVIVIAGVVPTITFMAKVAKVDLAALGPAGYPPAYMPSYYPPAYMPVGYPAMPPYGAAPYPNAQPAAAEAQAAAPQGSARGPGKLIRQASASATASAAPAAQAPAPAPAAAPKPAAAPVPKPSAPAAEAKPQSEKAGTTMTIEEALDQIVNNYNQEKVRPKFAGWVNNLVMAFPDLNRSFVYKINGDQGIEMSEGTDDTAPVKVTMASDMFVKLISKQINAIKAYSSGSLKVEGQMKNLLKLRSLMF